MKRIGAAILLGVIALQFIRPLRPNPPLLPGHDLMASNAPPREIAAILKNSCYDCHSYETRWPWYGHIAPVSWLLVRDVDAARASMNFSEWPHGDASRERKRWRHIADDVQSGDMPIPSYVRIHSEARLDARQRAELVKWAQQQAEP